VSDALDAIVADTPYSRTDALLSVVGVTAAACSPIAQACLLLFVRGAPFAIEVGTAELVVLPALWAGTIALAVGLSVDRGFRAVAFGVSTLLLAAAVSAGTAALLY
jgi:hypothetical protein